MSRSAPWWRCVTTVIRPQMDKLMNETMKMNSRGGEQFNGRIITRMALTGALVCAVWTVNTAPAADAPPKESRPAPRIEPLTIPEVGRNEVICFCLYTTRDRVLKLSAILYPLKAGESRTVTLDIERDGQWRKAAEAGVNPAGWTALFRVENWDETTDAKYRVTHPGGAIYEGLIRHNPREKDEIKIAVFTGNGNSDRGPRPDIVANIKAQDPDLLFFSGDQSYDHKQHTAAWLLFGRQFGEIIKDRPTVSTPDDHDVGQANLWGANGKVASSAAGDDGGYFMPVEYVNMVQRTQTSHLPDPYDPTPVQRGITVYFTSINVGGIDCAIIEDRKFKTGPNGLVPPQGPRPDHINDPSYDRATVDLPEAELLGARQLKFLREWGQEWAGAEMKAVLSQTIFAGGASLHGSMDNRLLADMDSNGWPQTGRAEALKELRRCFAIHLAGDQHLATLIHHGINEWEDACFSFCSPSIVNYYGRWWWPEEKPQTGPLLPELPFSGRFYDGFNNKITMHAYANPSTNNHRAAGYGLVRFKKSTREITLECWPRYVDVTRADARQFPGWPKTIKQSDNYGRKPMAWLPRLQIEGQANPVIQVINEANQEIVYTLRVNRTTFRPKVFQKGIYTIKVGEGTGQKVLEKIQSVAEHDAAELSVRF